MAALAQPDWDDLEEARAEARRSDLELYADDVAEELRREAWADAQPDEAA